MKALITCIRHGETTGYFSGASRRCVECHKIYMAKWRAENPEKTRRQYERAQARKVRNPRTPKVLCDAHGEATIWKHYGDRRVCHSCVLKRSKKFREAHAERIRTNNRTSYTANREKFSERAKKRWASKREEYTGRARRRREADPGKYKGYHAARYAADSQKYRDRANRYRRENAATVAAYNSRRRARKHRATVDGSVARLWPGILAAYMSFCAYCHNRATGQDHVIPLSRGGNHVASNVRPACGSCNSRKNASIWEPRPWAAMIPSGLHQRDLGTHDGNAPMFAVAPSTRT